MEFYLSQSYTYQAGQNDYRYVDLGRLPASEQQKALAALQNPGAPGNLVLLSGLQGKYPTAFAPVSSLSTLPAPDLSVPMGGSFPLGAGLDMILAYLNQKNFETANQLAEDGNTRVVHLNHMSLDLADDAKDKAESAAKNSFISGVVGGTVAVAAGAGSFAASVVSGVKTKANGQAMKESTRSQLDTQEYKDTMERNVKQLQDNAQSNRAQAQQLKGYADEIDSPDGLSPASRQKLDDSIVKKDAELAELDNQKNSYQRAMADADKRSKDQTLTQAERSAAKQEFDDLQAGEARFTKEIDAQRARVKQDRDALASVERMDADRQQLRLDEKRLKELEGNPAPTPAEAREMLELRQRMPARAESYVRQRASVQQHMEQLKAEASRMDTGAAELQKSAQDELASRKTVHEEQIADLNREMTDTELEIRGVTAATQALSQSTNLFSAGPQWLSQIDTAEKEHIQAQDQSVGTSKNLADKFAGELADKAKEATQFDQQYHQNQNEIATSFAKNI